MARKQSSWVHGAAILTGLTAEKVWHYADNHITPRSPNCFAVWLICWKRQKQVRKILVQWNDECKRREYDYQSRNDSRVKSTCSNCGSDFWALERSAKKYCSVKCASEGRTGSGFAETKTAEILSLYKTGLGCDAIAKHLGMKSKTTVRRVLKSHGSLDSKRTGRLSPKVKAPAKRFNPVSHIQKDINSFLAYENRHGEDNHWRYHPEVARWRSCKNAKIQYRKSKHRPEVKLRRALRLRLWKVLKFQDASKPASTMDLVGCDIQQLKEHFSSQFTGGMSFQNYGKAWEIDHIRPCASFDLKDAQQVRDCFHFSNLRPLGVSTNRKKHSWHNGRHHSHKRFTWEIKSNHSLK